MKKSTVIAVVGIALAVGVGVYLYKRRKGVSATVFTNEDGSKTIRIGEDSQQDIIDEGVNSISAILKQQSDMGMNFTEYTNMGGNKSFYQNETEEKLNMGGNESFYLNEENYSADGYGIFCGKKCAQDKKDRGIPPRGQDTGLAVTDFIAKNSQSSIQESKGTALGIGSMIENKGLGSGIVTGAHLQEKYLGKGRPQEITDKLMSKHKDKMSEKIENKIARWEAIKSKLDALEKRNNPEIRGLISSIRAKANGLALAIGKNYSKEQKDKVLAFLYEIQSDPKLRTTLISRAINQGKEIGDVMLEEATANVEKNVNFDGAEMWTNADGQKHWGMVGIWDGSSKGTKKSYVSQPYVIDYSTGLINFTGTLSNDRTWTNCCGK